MHEEFLKEIGLTHSEIAVYHALINLKSSTTGPIVKHANISSGKVYEILNKLLKKGLVTYIIRSGRKYFQPNSPERILDYLEIKDKQFHELKKTARQVVTSFEQQLNEKEIEQQAEIFEGVEGFKTFSEFCLKKLTQKTDYCILGVSREVNERFGGYLLDWQKRRAQKGIRLRVIYNHDAKEHAELRKKITLTQVRYLFENMKTPALIEIFDDYVATLIVAPKPIVFMIKSKQAAQSYLQYFNLLWNQTKP